MKQNIITHAERVIRQALNLSGRTVNSNSKRKEKETIEFVILVTYPS